jgi:hypothetical protein
MSWLQHILRTKPQPEEPLSPAPVNNRSIMPTVKFDASLVTKKVKADLRKSVEELEDVPKEHACKIYDAALAMIEAGGNMPLLYNVLLKLNGMSKGRAGEITRLLLNKAKALTEQEKRSKFGITHASWMYANAPCMVNPSHPTDADRKQDAAHQAANGKQFEIGKGLLINGEWTLPGRGDGCKCVSRSVIPGLENFKS